MKHCFTKLIGMLMAVAAVSALPVEANATGKAVVVISKDGSRQEVELQQVSRIDVGRESVTVNDRSGQATEHSFENIDRILIGADAAGVKELIADGGVAVWPTVTTGMVNVSGLEVGCDVAVFDVNGAKVAEATASDSTVTIDLSGNAGGVYVVAFGSQSVKVIKK